MPSLQGNIGEVAIVVV